MYNLFPFLIMIFFLFLDSFLSNPYPSSTLILVSIIGQSLRTFLSVHLLQLINLTSTFYTSSFSSSLLYALLGFLLGEVAMWLVSSCKHLSLNTYLMIFSRSNSSSLVALTGAAAAGSAAAFSRGQAAMATTDPKVKRESWG